MSKKGVHVSHFLIPIQGKYIKSVVYGGLDGIITTFAVVSGVAGASLAASIVLILGFANLFADGISMATGDYLSTKAENKYLQKKLAKNKTKVSTHIDSSKADLLSLFTKQGFTKSVALKVVTIMMHRKRALANAIFDDHGQDISEESPTKNAIVTFASFVTFGFIPLLAYVASQFFTGLIPYQFATSCVLTILTLGLLGLVKANITEDNYFRSSVETMLIGGVAACTAYFIGYAISLIV